MLEGVSEQDAEKNIFVYGGGGECKQIVYKI
jgi:hypothetical protein